LSDGAVYSLVAANGAGENSASATLTVLPASNLLAGLIGYWPLDITTNGATPDLTTNANHLFLTNMTGANIVSGMRSNAFNFNGADQLLARIYSPGGVFPAYQYQGFSAALWVRGASNQSDRRVFSEGSTSGNNQLVNIGTDNGGASGKVDLFYRTDGGTALLNHPKSNTNGYDGVSWHHIALVDALGAVTLYIDGVRDTNFSYVRGALTLNVVSIGGIQRAAASSWFAGQIDDVAVWRRALSSNDVASMYANGLSGAPFVTQQPVSQSVPCGAGVVLSFNATNVLPVTYQWYLGGAPVAGATNGTLAFAAGNGNAGNYFAVASTAFYSTTSSVATVAINPAPSLLSPAGNLAVGTLTNSCGALFLAGGAAYDWELRDASLGAGTGWDVVSVLGGVDVQATAGSPYTINLISLNGASPGLANFNNNATNVFTLATATAGVTNFDASKFTLNTAQFSNDLGGGVFGIEEGSIKLRFTPNHGPVALSITNNRAPNTVYKIKIADLLSGATSDADGDARVITALSASTNGASITTNATHIIYSNPNNVEDQFTYTVRDVRSYRPNDVVRTATAVIRFTVNAPAGTNQNVVSFAVVNGKPTIRFAGIPGYAYDVQRTADLTPPANWTTLRTTNAPPLGIFEFVDENPPVGQAYYRTAQH
jgi:hypothetical protein